MTAIYVANTVGILFTFYIMIVSNTSHLHCKNLPKSLSLIDKYLEITFLKSLKSIPHLFPKATEAYLTPIFPLN